MKTRKTPDKNVVEDLAPIVLVELISPDETKIKCQTSLDSGSSSTVLDQKKAQVFGVCQKSQHHILTTVMGSVVNNKSAVVQFRLPELSPTLEINWECDVMEDMSNTPYDMIIRYDVLEELKIDIHSSNLTVSMGDASIPWKPRNHKNESYLFNADADMDDNEADRLKKILDAKYDPADLDKLVSESGLKPKQKIGLLRLLQRFEELFD